MSQYIPIIETTQCNNADFVSITPVEVKGRQFPMSKDEILENLKDENLHAVRTMLDYKCQAWCLFSVVEGNIVIHRLTVKDVNHLLDVVHNLFETITYAPNRVSCRVSINWPEYGTEDFLFRHLLSTGWTTDGLIKDHYEAYGETWDAIKLERHF
jgi:hypothetical protein